MRSLATRLQAVISHTSFLTRGIGLVYLWFGLLKFFPGLSPAEELAGTTIHLLSAGLLEPQTGLLLLAVWESAVGILLLSGFCRRCALDAALVHIVFTFTPLFLLPELCFTRVPYGLTLVGQYIVKNIVFLGVMLALLHKDPFLQNKKRPL